MCTLVIHQSVQSRSLVEAIFLALLPPLQCGVTASEGTEGGAQALRFSLAYLG